MQQICYTEGYRFQLRAATSYQLRITLPHAVVSETGLFGITETGLFWINANYAWNGANKPAINTKTIIPPSLFHDAGYQLLEEELLGREYKAFFDDMFREMCLECGMAEIRTWYAHRAVKRFGRADKPKPLLYAP